jgi:hypothetical protein
MTYRVLSEGVSRCVFARPPGGSAGVTGEEARQPRRESRARAIRRWETRIQSAGSLGEFPRPVAWLGGSLAASGEGCSKLVCLPSRRLVAAPRNSAVDERQSAASSASRLGTSLISSRSIASVRRAIRSTSVAISSGLGLEQSLRLDRVGYALREDCVWRQGMECGLGVEPRAEPLGEADNSWRAACRRWSGPASGACARTSSIAPTRRRRFATFGARSAWVSV